MKSNLSKSKISLLLYLAMLSGLNPTTVLAQDNSEDQNTSEANDDDDDEVVDFEPVVATGSRLLRQTYDSISPMQVITADESREVGQIDAGDIIQNSTASSGQQIDLTFSGFVLDNGPGARTASFRGLGAGRTLVMLNGRRVGGSGVEGAPSSPDLNMIPGGLVQQYDLLLDGSSSIYGSDAIAGVANAVLRKDFNGWEVDFNTTVPEQSGGVENRLSLTWGKNFDRGFIGFGAEVYDLEEVKYKDRDWTNHCPQHREVTESGELRMEDIYSQDFLLQDRGSCYTSGVVGRIQLIGFAPTGALSFYSAYYTPGFSNGGYPDFTLYGGGAPRDTNGDGVADTGPLTDFSLYDHETDASLFLELKTQNLFTYGEYTFEGDNNITPFFELGFSRRDTFQDSGQAQFFPWVPATNPYNICNPNGVNGIDCGLAYDQIPGVQNNIGPFGPVRTRPIIAIDGDRDQTSATVEQTRFLAGVKGDLPQLNIGTMDSWVFETYFSYHESDGTASRRGIREDHLNYSLETSRIDPATGQVICGYNNDGCVPINLYAPSLYNPVLSDFTTQAQRDFLFDSRDFRTKVEQTIWSAFATGYIYDLPAGPITGGLGFEIRKDEIQSIPDDVAGQGLFFGFFADGGASGSKFTREAFAELEIPVLANMPGAQELTLNLSGRYTKDEFFPSANTYSVKVGWRPVESLLLRATYGTSYRAPNLRENFLLSQTGFSNVTDPCIVPDDAIDPVTGDYMPGGDDRQDYVLDNCRAAGVDPTTLYYAQSSVEVATGGAIDISEEESDSFTYGFAWDVPFDSFNLTLGATYYSIKINNTIVEPTGGYIVNACYYEENLNSPFCDRIIRDAEGELTYVDAGFVNRDNQTVRGVDVNINYDQTFQMFDRAIDFGADLVLTHTEESSELFEDDNGNVSFDDDAGEYGFPDWGGTLNLRADIGKFRLAWQTRYIGKVHVDEDNDNSFDDYYGNMYTCAGPDNGDELCQFVWNSGSYTNHTASVSYRSDDWTIRFGVANLFGKEPPQIDAGAPILTAANSPQGYGYDLNGRRYFLNVGYRF